jgi:hypothetical protein
MTSEGGSGRVARLLARAQYCRQQASKCRDPEIVSAFQELARGFEAEAALRAIREKHPGGCWLH